MLYKDTMMNGASPLKFNQGTAASKQNYTFCIKLFRKPTFVTIQYPIAIQNMKIFKGLISFKAHTV